MHIHTACVISQGCSKTSRCPDTGQLKKAEKATSFTQLTAFLSVFTLFAPSSATLQFQFPAYSDAFLSNTNAPQKELLFCNIALLQASHLQGKLAFLEVEINSHPADRQPQKSGGKEMLPNKPW